MKKVNLNLFLIAIILLCLSQVSWIEPTEWGLILSKKISLSEINFFHQKSLSDFSFLNLLAALMIKIIGAKSTNTFLFITINFTAFYSIYLMSSYFDEDSQVKFFMPFLFLLIKLIDSHGYKIVYPNNFWVYGQFGMYLSLLSLSLYLLKFKKSFFVAFLLNALIHPVWFIGTTFLILLDTFKNNKKEIKNIIYSLSICIFSVLIIKLLYEYYFFDYRANYEFNLNTKGKIKNISLDGHNTLLKANNLIDTAINTLKFFYSEIILIFLFFISINNSKIKNVRLIISIFLLPFVILKFYEIYDNNLIIFQNLNLVNFYLRAIPERFFNITTIISHLILFYLILEKLFQRNFGLIYITTISIIIIFEITLGNGLNNQKKIYTYLVIIIFLISYILNKNNGEKIKIIHVNKDTIVSVFLVILSVVSIFHIIKYQRLNYESKEDEIVEFLNKNYKNEIIIAGSYVFSDEFNPIIEFKKEVIIPSKEIKFKNRNLYCDNNGKWNDWYNNIKNCFEKYERNEWLEINKHLNVKYILVSNKWRIKDLNFIKGKKFNLYFIE